MFVNRDDPLFAMDWVDEALIGISVHVPESKRWLMLAPLLTLASMVDGLCRTARASSRSCLMALVLPLVTLTVLLLEVARLIRRQMGTESESPQAVGLVVVELAEL